MFGGAMPPRTFNTQFRCYPVVMFPGNEREDVERGGKSKSWLLQNLKTTYHLISIMQSPDRGGESTEIQRLIP